MKKVLVCQQCGSKQEVKALEGAVCKNMIDGAQYVMGSDGQPVKDENGKPTGEHKIVKVACGSRAFTHVADVEDEPAKAEPKATPAPAPAK